MRRKPPVTKITPNADRQTPKLTLLSGMEIIDRRSSSVIPSPPAPFPNTLAPLAGKGETKANSLVIGYGGQGPNALFPNTEHRKPNTECANAQYQILNTLPVRRKRPTIALCMIMRDEEKVIDACLESVKPYFDSIYILDTGSVDSSIERAKSHGAIVAERPWDFSFSNARNASLDMARDEDYVAWVDCDDVMPPKSGEGMHRLVSLAEDRVTGYIMQVHIPPKPGTDGYSVVDHIKLFRHNWPSKSNPIRWIGRIHEQILSPLYDAGGTIERTNLYVVHAGYDYSDAGQAKKRKRDYTILALDEGERPSHPFPKFNYGMTYLFNEEYVLAIQKLKECLALSQPQESTVRKAYAMLAQCYEATQDLDSARAALDMGLALSPNDSELLFRSANLYWRLGDAAASEKFYHRLFNRPPAQEIDSLDTTILTYKGRHNYALSLMDLGRFEDAEAQIRTGLSINPTFVPTWVSLAELYMRRRRFDDARAVINKIEGMSAQDAQKIRTRLVELQGISVV